jgi:CubicO group peptidase (beta-lactamase class C family)
VAATALWTELPPAEVDALAQALIDQGYCQALVVGLVSEHSELWRGYGEGPPTEETLFEIGSVTKALTGLLLAQALAAGEVALDEPITALLPQGASAVAGPEAVTLRMLATHTSGLPRLPTNWDAADAQDPYASYDEAALLTAAGGGALRRGERAGSYHYSNFGMGLLGYALGARAGASYEDALRARVLTPAGLDSTMIRVSSAAAARLAQGYDSDGEKAQPWRFDALAGAGALRSTVADMIHLVRLNLVPERVPALTEAVRLSQAPAAQRPQGAMGLGWHIGFNVEGGAQVLWHSGQTGGYHAFVAFDPKRLKGVVVLAAGASDQVDLLGAALLQRLRGLPAPALDLPPPLVATSPEALEPLVGVYAVTLVNALEVTREGDRLYARMTGQPRLRVFPAADGRFYYRAVKASLAFQRGDGGEVTGLILYQGGHEMPAQKVATR